MNPAADNDELAIIVSVHDHKLMYRVESFVTVSAGNLKKDEAFPKLV